MGWGAIGIWRGAISFHSKHLGGGIKIQSVFCTGGAILTYFNNRSGLEKYFNEYFSLPLHYNLLINVSNSFKRWLQFMSIYLMCNLMRKKLFVQWDCIVQGLHNDF